MEPAWHDEFRQRMADFDGEMTSSPAGVSLSIKVRVCSGCFHREHSPNAFATLDDYLATHPIDRDTTRYIERESGPELLLYLAITTAGLTLVSDTGKAASAWNRTAWKSRLTVVRWIDKGEFVL